MKKLWQEHTLLIVCSVISCLLLLLFAFLQYKDNPILKLDGKWLGVVGIPLLVALVAGGHIKKFKGFGVELQAKMKSPVASVASIRSTLASSVISLRGADKRSVSRLEDFTSEQISQTTRLSFTSGPGHNYEIFAIKQYFFTLWNLQYIEVRGSSGEFICLVPVDIFRQKINYNQCARADFNEAEIHRFIEALENNSVQKDFSDACICLTIKWDTPLLTTLKILRDNGQKIAVVTANQDFIGLVREHEIVRRIADEVLSASFPQK